MRLSALTLLSIKNKIVDLSLGFSDVIDITEVLFAFLIKLLPFTFEIFKNENLPQPTYKRFFSQTSTIRNHVTHAKRKLCLSLIDQECLQEKIDQWETADKSVKILKVLSNKIVMKN